MSRRRRGLHALTPAGCVLAALGILGGLLFVGTLIHAIFVK